jgi:outer membrane receptor for ferrienterochelin and colicins
MRVRNKFIKCVRRIWRISADKEDRWRRGAVLLLLLSLGVSPQEAHGQAPATVQAHKDLSQLSMEELMNVQVDTVYGASKFQQKVTEAPSSITIITADEIQKYGYRTVSDLLQSVPGFYVTNDRNYSYVGVDGISRPTDYSTHLLVLIDGHRVNDNVYNAAYVGTEAILDVDLIARVEIIRGPGSSLYGANAFLGVINIITKRGADLKGVEISADAGSLQTYRERATYGQQYASGLEFLLSETFYNSNGNSRLDFPAFNFAATNNGIAQNVDADQFFSGFLSTSYRDFTLRAGYVSREKHIPTASFGTVFNDPRTKTTDARAYSDLQYHHTFGNNWEINARGSYDWYEYDGVFIYDHSGAGTPPYTVNLDYERQNWWGLDFSVSRRLAERHHLTLGTEETFNTKQVLGNFDQTPYFLYLSDRHSSTQSSFYFQDEFAIRKNLLLSAGVRYDHYSTFGSTVNPRLGLIFSPRENTDIKILYGQAFRAPDDYQLYYSDPAAGIEPSSGLRPETIKTAEVIFEKYFWQHASLSASGFYNWIDHLISQRTDPANGMIQFTNLEGIRGKGLEFELSAKPLNGWEGRLSYTLQESYSSIDREPLTNSPRHLAKFNLIAPLIQKRVFASFEGQEISRRLTEAGGKIGGSFVANATLYYQHLPGNLRISASLYNLFNKHYAEPVGQEIQGANIVQDGRTFRVKLTYRFGGI